MLKNTSDKQTVDLPGICVIVLNWNGWQDTIECAESILKQDYPACQLLIMDNGSSDDSIARIKNWMNNTAHIGFVEYSRVDITTEDLIALKNEEKKFRSKRHIILIRNEENLGFAAGNNIGINYALKFDFKYILILNNDAVVGPGTLLLLVAALERENKYGAATPQIRYYYEPERIANSGGFLTVTGHRKYYDGDRLARDISKTAIREISFITGCALFVRSDTFRKYGILSQNFFFGEEDYEFSLRMRKNHVRLACVMGALVYHKISRARVVLWHDLDSVFMHYFNRFVNYREYYSNFYWNIWRFGSFIYILPMLYFRYRFKLRKLVYLARTLIKYSSNCKVASKQYVEKACKELAKC